MKILILIISWGIYFFLHSLLASTTVKIHFKSWFGLNFRYYRIAYIVASVTGLLGIMIFSGSIPSTDYFAKTGIARYFSLVFAAFGVIVIKLAFRAYNFSSFIGLEPEDEQLFKTSGILKSIRHPIYSGTILIVIGFWFFSPNLPTLVSVLCVLVYLPVGIILEERKLIDEFGEQYLEYKDKTPALFPRIF